MRLRSSRCTVLVFLNFHLEVYDGRLIDLIIKNHHENRHDQKEKFHHQWRRQLSILDRCGGVSPPARSATEFGIRPSMASQSTSICTCRLWEGLSFDLIYHFNLWLGACDHQLNLTNFSNLTAILFKYAANYLVAVFNYLNFHNYLKRVCYGRRGTSAGPKSHWTA